MKWTADKSLIPYLTDPELKIPDSHLIKVCKRSLGSQACRYIALSGNGHCCMKNTPLRSAIDSKVNGDWLAKGDNCDGFIPHAKNKDESSKK